MNFQNQDAEFRNTVRICFVRYVKNMFTIAFFHIFLPKSGIASEIRT